MFLGYCGLSSTVALYEFPPRPSFSYLYAVFHTPVILISVDQLDQLEISFVFAMGRPRLISWTTEMVFYTPWAPQLMHLVQE